MKEFGSLILICITLICIINFIIFIIQEFRNTTLRHKRFHDIPVKVCKKEYHEDEYIVYVMFEGTEYSFINKKLYYETCVNEVIFVCVHKGYNRKGKLKNVYLTL